jgi:hypothetical protein
MTSLYTLNLRNQAKQKIYGDDWNNIIQLQLNEIREQLCDDSELHNIAGDYNSEKGNILSILLIIFSTITNILLSFEAMTTSKTQISIILIFSIITSSTVTAINAFLSLFDYKKKANNHNEIANEYSALAMYILEYLNLPAHKRPDCQVIFENARNKRQYINQRAEKIPVKLKESYYKKNRNRFERKQIELSSSWNYTPSSEIKRNKYRNNQQNNQQNNYTNINKYIDTKNSKKRKTNKYNRQDSDNLLTNDNTYNIYGTKKIYIDTNQNKNISSSSSNKNTHLNKNTDTNTSTITTTSKKEHSDSNNDLSDHSNYGKDANGKNANSANNKGVNSENDKGVNSNKDVNSANNKGVNSKGVNSSKDVNIANSKGGKSVNSANSEGVNNIRDVSSSNSGYNDSKSDSSDSERYENDINITINNLAPGENKYKPIEFELESLSGNDIVIQSGNNEYFFERKNNLISNDCIRKKNIRNNIKCEQKILDYKIKHENILFKSSGHII